MTDKTIIVITGVGVDYEHTIYFKDLKEVETWLQGNDADLKEGRCVGNWYEVYVQKNLSKYLERKSLWLN